MLYLNKQVLPFDFCDILLNCTLRSSPGSISYTDTGSNKGWDTESLVNVWVKVWAQIILHFQQLLNRTLITVESQKVVIVSSYLRATWPLHHAWKLMMMSVIFMSLSSSRWARTPALKNTLLWPIRYRLGSSSRLLIWQHRKHTDQSHCRGTIIVPLS